jgi:hypothetical protein
MPGIVDLSAGDRATIRAASHRRRVGHRPLRDHCAAVVTPSADRRQIGWEQARCKNRARPATTFFRWMTPSMPAH